MESAGATFADALATAQELGYAEADPTDDVEGYDARAKLAILCAVGLRVQVVPGGHRVPADHRRRRGGLPVRASSSGARSARSRRPSSTRPIRRGCIASVRPSLVPRRSMLARAEGSKNLIVARGHYGGDTVYSGSGAGGGPTSVAVVSDLAAIARARAGTAGRGAPAAGVACRPGVPDARTTCASWSRIGPASSPRWRRSWRRTTSTSTRCCSSRSTARRPTRSW